MNADYSMADSKDWTWVLEKPCPECGFDGAGVTRFDIAPALRAQVEEFAELAKSPLAQRRPSPQVWSAHEYICHVRDVYELYSTRLGLMVHEDNPLYPNWDQDETAAADNYSTQDSAQAVVDLIANGQKLADEFEALFDEQWARVGRRSDGASFTIDTFGRYLAHDPHHHLWDIRQGFVRLS